MTVYCTNELAYCIITDTPSLATSLCTELAPDSNPGCLLPE